VKKWTRWHNSGECAKVLTAPQKRVAGRKRMILFYFTGTGNSMFVAQKIATETGAKLISIPQVIDEEREYSDDCIGFIYPQYANSLPKMVRKFILKNKFSAKYFFAVNLWAFIHLGAIGEIAGILPLDYGAYLKTPNNFTFLLNSPKDPKARLNKAERHLAKIVNDIQGRKSKSVKPRKGEGNATKYFGESKFKVTQKCIKCGTCKDVCPARNIVFEEDGIVFGRNCETCFACANLCPQHAIYSKERMLKRRQYRNPYISVEEIKETNNVKERN